MRVATFNEAFFGAKLKTEAVNTTSAGKERITFLKVVLYSIISYSLAAVHLAPSAGVNLGISVTGSS